MGNLYVLSLLFPIASSFFSGHPRVGLPESPSYGQSQIGRSIEAWETRRRVTLAQNIISEKRIGWHIAKENGQSKAGRSSGIPLHIHVQ